MPHLAGQKLKELMLQRLLVMFLQGYADLGDYSSVERDGSNYDSLYYDARVMRDTELKIR